MNLINNNREIIFLIYSFFIVLSVFVLGNFGFFNIFNIKLEITIVVISVLMTISIYIFFNNNKLCLFTSLILYLFISSLFLEKFNFNYSIKLFIIFFLLNGLFFLDDKYINLIIKSIIVISFLFSIVGVSLFIFYSLNEELLLDLERVYRANNQYADLSWIPFHQKFGFVIEVKEKNLFGISYIRSRSFCSEPSLTLPIFFAVGILSLSYESFFKLIGSIILIYSIIFIYSGSSVLSLIFSFFCFLIFHYTSYSILSKSLILISGVFIAFIIIYYIDMSVFKYITPESKITSLPSRIFPIKDAIDTIFSNPFYSVKDKSSSFISLLYVFSGVIPIFGILFLVYIFYKMFIFTISLYTEYWLYSLLTIGLLLQVLLFSSGSWITISGIVILYLMYRRLEIIYRDTNNE